jgi:uncharacterized protein YcsI (UPF0317 family)
MDADRHGLARPQRLTCKAIFATENDRMENGLHDPQDRANLSPLDARKLFRSGAFTGPTSGISMGHVQANIVILPYEPASQFVRFCVRNSRCCPLIGVSEAGGIGLDALGADIDMRSDLPKYRIYRHGKLDREAQDISQYWRDDFVIFAIGCSFSFEEGMLSAGLPVRHIETGSIVPMYRTNLPTEPAGAFGGPYVVSMRPLPPADVERAVEVTSRFPYAHGAPVHWGNPSEIGITDLACPERRTSAVLDPQTGQFVLTQRQDQDHLTRSSSVCPMVYLYPVPLRVTVAGRDSSGQANLFHVCFTSQQCDRTAAAFDLEEHITLPGQDLEATILPFVPPHDRFGLGREPEVAAYLQQVDVVEIEVRAETH